MPDGLDAIVVGSGIGGLTTASLMAKAGKKVLVLEQHDRAGGCTHTFVEQGYEFDIGELKAISSQLRHGVPGQEIRVLTCF